MKGLSLFANVGVAELLLEKTGHEVVVANELLDERVKFYSHVYPEVTMIQGDITDKKIFSKVMEESKKNNVEFIMATPPCQGMSLNGKKDPFDPRNQLITYAIDAILELKPKYVFLENVPQQLKTEITYKNQRILVPDYITKKLSEFYEFQSKVIDTSKLGVPQKRKRSIYLLSRKDQKKWTFPEDDKQVVTVRDVIGHLKPLAPYIYGQIRDRKNAEHKWHLTPVHNKNHIEWMENTPTGKSAFLNDVHFPRKEDGTRISGGSYAYMRMNWDKPAPTVTTNNGVISSFTNVHPGRPLKNGKYSDPRVLTIFETMLISSIPGDWKIPEWASEKLIRTVIGEGIPPLAVKRIFERINY